MARVVRAAGCSAGCATRVARVARAAGCSACATRATRGARATCPLSLHHHFKHVNGLNEMLNTKKGREDLEFVEKQHFKVCSGLPGTYVLGFVKDYTITPSKIEEQYSVKRFGDQDTIYDAEKHFWSSVKSSRPLYFNNINGQLKDSGTE